MFEVVFVEEQFIVVLVTTMSTHKTDSWANSRRGTKASTLNQVHCVLIHPLTKFVHDAAAYRMTFATFLFYFFFSFAYHTLYTI